MEISANGLNLIKSFEGYSPTSYQDSVGVWTIGYGSTMWNDGKRVIEGQVITKDGAEKVLNWEVTNKTASINSMLAPTVVNQNQFDSLFSFTYNLGVGDLRSSTLLKKVKVNPNDTSIRNEFMRWNKAGGQVLKGLTIRRQKEADNYFNPTL